MREAFEKWCRKTRPVLSTSKVFYGDAYSSDKTRAAWSAWQKAWEMSRNDNH